MSQERELFEWVKASEQKPARDIDISMRYDGYPIIGIFYTHNSAIWNKTDEEWILEFDFNRLEWLKPITKPVIKEDDLNDLIAMLSFGGFLSDRIAVKEAAIKIKRFIENMNFSLKPESISDSE